MRYLVSVVLVALATAGAFGDDDIRAFVREQSPRIVSQDKSKDDIKEFARYQRERLRTYKDAVDQHDKTKTVVIVWVGFTDGDQLFQHWKATKDLGYHVFVTDFEGVFGGVVVGRDFSGTFGRLETITSDFATRIREQATMQFQKSSGPTCVGGKCYFPSTSTSSSCPNGRCPTR